jgi:signal transduction histidine kinase/CheY-like chemotaxis protein
MDPLRLRRLLLLLLPLWCCGCAGGSEQTASLVGRWEYRVGFDPRWLSEPPESGWRSIPIPHRFGPEDGVSGPGWITVRRTVPASIDRLLREGEPAGLESGLVSDVSRFYLNGRLVGRLGSVSPYASGLYRRLLIDISPRDVRTDGPNVLTVALYTNGVYPLHIEGPRIQLGRAEEIFSEYYTREILAFMRLAVYLVIGLYHLLLAARRPRDLYNAYFGLTALLFSAYWFFRTGTRDALFQEHVLLRVKVEYVVLFSIGPALAFFISQFFRGRHSRIGIVSGLLCLVLSVVTVIGPYPAMRACLQVWQICAIPVMLCLVYFTARELREKHESSRHLMFGLTLLVLGVIHDIAARQGLVPNRIIAEYGYFVFMLGIASMLAQRFVQLHNRVEELNVTLERKVGERTGELMTARDAAESASRAKSLFLANMSHEIRTPMNAILGMTDLLLESPLSHDQRGLLRVLRASADTLLNFLNNVLDLTKMDAGKIAVEQVEFQLRSTLEEMLAPFVIQARQRGLELSLRVSERVPDQVAGDPFKLRQIVTNLVSNAIKFSDEGRVTVTVELLEPTPEMPDTDLSAANALTLEVRIRDSGIGIPADKQSQIFDSFTQVDSSTTRRYGGTGLGTTIARQLVELMGGTIGVVSPVPALEGAGGGPGSEFWFTFPCRRRPGLEPGQAAPTAERPPAAQAMETVPAGVDAFHAAPTAPTGVGTFPPAALRHGIAPEPGAGPTQDADPTYGADPTVEARPRILVAEDNIVNQMIIKRLLESLRFDADLAPDGRAAVEMATSQPYAAILMDVQMPRMNGYEATRAIRQRQTHRVPILALTANVFQEDIERCLEAGMDACLPKPCSKLELKDMLDRWVPRRNA